MRHAIQGWVRSFSRRVGDRFGHSRRPVVEGLEVRSLLSVAVAHDLVGHHHVAAHAAIGHVHAGPDAYSPFPDPARYGHQRFARERGGPNAYQQTNLVSDFPVGVEGVNPQLQDTSLLNPWGLASGPKTPIWISDQVTGVSTLYSIGPNETVQKIPLTVKIPSSVTQPSQGFTPLTGPTGIVFNASGTGFDVNGSPSVYIFSTLDGTLAGWNKASGTTAVVMASQAPAEEFTGLAMASSGGQTYLYTADPRLSPGIDVFNSSWSKVALAGNFVDPRLPAGMTPYNIQALDGHLFVAYIGAAQGGGAVAEFNTDGTFVRQLPPSGPAGPLQGPWGMAIAPSNFGHFSNDLLVGSFYDGRISAFNLGNGRFLGQLKSANGQPVVIPFLWGLDFGNGVSTGPTNSLLFTAGIAGQYHGLFGALMPTRPMRR